MDGRVDPASPLREKNHELIGHGGLADCLWHENLLTLGESPQHQSRQITILTEKQQVLVVKGFNDVFGVMLDDVRVSQNGDPIVLVALGCLDAVHAETTGKTCDTSEDGFERLGQVM